MPRIDWFPKTLFGRTLLFIALVVATGALALAAIEPLTHLTDPTCKHSAIHFKLGFAWPPAHADTASLTLQVAPCPHQARRLMLQVRQLHLQSALGAASTLPEDVQNELGAVEHSHLPHAFQIALLDCGNLMVEQHDLCATAFDQGTSDHALHL